jgi:hypothetical protein
MTETYIRFEHPDEKLQAAGIADDAILEIGYRLELAEEKIEREVYGTGPSARSKAPLVEIVNIRHDDTSNPIIITSSGANLPKPAPTVEFQPRSEFEDSLEPLAHEIRSGEMISARDLLGILLRIDEICKIRTQFWHDPSSSRERSEMVMLTAIITGLAARMGTSPIQGHSQTRSGEFKEVTEEEVRKILEVFDLREDRNPQQIIITKDQYKTIAEQNPPLSPIDLVFQNGSKTNTLANILKLTTWQRLIHHNDTWKPRTIQ